MEMVTDHTLIHPYLDPSFHSFVYVYVGINLSFQIMQGRKGGTLGYDILHQFSEIIYELLQTVANLQTQTTKWVHKYRWHAPGLWQEYTTPLGYRSVSVSSPTLSSEMHLCMEQEWRGTTVKLFSELDDLDN